MPRATPDRLIVKWPIEGPRRKGWIQLADAQDCGECVA
jgi:hypothetical protein